MYGFLQLDRCKLSPKGRTSYTQMYCGQCSALHKLYGYSRRSLVSYDATFLGLLLSAQMDDEPKQAQSRCGVFPKRITIHDSAELPQVFSASMAAIICAMKFSDAQQDGKSYFKTIASKIFLQTFNNAEETLRSLHFPVNIVAETLERQQKIESSDRLSIKSYSEPTALFTAEIFRFTATATENFKNETALYEIGYHVGQLIYLVDSCIDIIDDLDKDNFNGLMAAYRNDETFLSNYSRDEVTAIAINALTRITELILSLDLKRHQEIVYNILLVGLPKTIHQRITKSISRLQKGKETLLEYLPHTALASALCLLQAKNAEAGWIWGQGSTTNSYIGYGYHCDCFTNVVNSSSKPDDCCTLWIEAPLNPFICWVNGNNPGTGPCICCCQLPKMGLSTMPLWASLSHIPDFLRRQQDASSERQRRQEADKKAQIAKSKQENLSKNREFTGRYTREIQNNEQYFKSIGFSYRINDNINNLINSAGSKDDEAISEKHELIRQIESLMSVIREDKQRIESTYSKQAARSGRNTGKGMVIYENVAARKLTTLLISCATSSQSLVNIAVEDFEQTDAHRLWQQLDEYYFINANAKRLQENLKRFSLNVLKNKNFTEIILIYSQIKELKTMIEKSNQSLFNSQIHNVDVIHKEWNWYLAKLKA